MNSFVICYFLYCPAVLMFHSLKLNDRINRFHKRALRAAYIDLNSYFEELLRKVSATTLHQRNVMTVNVMTEIFKVKTRIASELMKRVFEFADVPYILRSHSKCNHSIPCTERYSIETASFVGLKLWDKVPTEIKTSKSLEEFKAQIKSWVPKNYPARYVNCQINM